MCVAACPARRPKAEGRPSRPIDAARHAHRVITAHGTPAVARPSAFSRATRCGGTSGGSSSAKRGNVGKVVPAGTHQGGDTTEGWRRRRGTAAFRGSAMSCGSWWRWWSAPGALVNREEVRSGRNLEGKNPGREAKVAAMAAPKPVEWRGVRCPRRASRACSAGMEGDGA
jgi:hypothetical protein